MHDLNPRIQPGDLDSSGNFNRSSKPQPQVVPLPLDILATLADFIPKSNQICDQLHAKSLVLEDDYCKAGDKANTIFDLCGELQADYAEIIREEFQQEG
jgi:hypothetical protein